MDDAGERIVCTGEVPKRALKRIAELENELEELKEVNKHLDNQVMIWKHATLCETKAAQTFKLTKDPYSPIGMRIEPVIE